MPSFGAASRTRLATAHPDLQRLFNEVIKDFDCTVIFGHRTPEEQQALYAQGRTKPGRIVTYKDGVTKLSKHNEYPALAVDVTPYPIVWADTNRMYYFAGVVMATARRLGLRVRWGGDWDNDTLTSDERFVDLPHFELAR